MVKSYVFRLTAEGVKELERDLKSLGASGERAFEELQNRVPGLGGALDNANRKVDEFRKGLLDASAAHEKMGANLSGLIARYTSWAAVIITARNAMNTAAESNEKAAAAMEKLDKAWSGFAESAATVLTPAVESAADLLSGISDIYKLLMEGNWDTAWERFWKGFSEGTSIDVSKLPPNDPRRQLFDQMAARNQARPRTSVDMAVAPPESYYAQGTPTTFNARTGNYTPGTGGFGEFGVTDLTALEKARADAAKRASELADKELQATLARIQKETDWWNAFYENKRQQADKSASESAERQKTLNADVHDQILDLSRQGMVVEKENAEKRADIYKEEDRQAKERADRIAGYWTDTLDAMTADGRNFFETLFETGEGNLKDFVNVFKNAWARLLSDLVSQQFVAPLMRSVLGQMGPLVGQVAGGGAPGGLLGGGGGGGILGGLGGALGLGGLLGGATSVATGYYNTSQGLIPSGVSVTPAQGLGGAFQYQGFGFGSALGGAAAGAGIGSIAGMVGGNTTGGSIGGAIGGAIGSIWGPLGTMAGSALGGLVGGMFGGKPSNYRATATFGPGGAYELSGDKPNEQTLALAQQAAAGISEQIRALTAFGVEFTQQLSNVWIGARDASSYQLAGGQRVSVGTVGDVADLTADTIAQLLKTATSSDPEIAAILKAGGSAQAVTQSLQAVQASRAFSAEITQALLEIQDPMKAAIALWQKEAQARLDTAAALGVSTDAVKELNAALYQQIVQQQNAGVISSIGGYLQSMQYGAGSSAAPKTQYAAALKDYEASRAAALKGGAPEAQAYLATTQAFLPFAREYLGTTQAYETIRAGAESTLQGLMGKLAAPSMPELVTPIVAATTSVGAATVEAIEGVKAETKGLRESVDRLFGEFGALLRQVKPA